MFERVLIVDDNKLDRFITSHAFKKADAAIDCLEYDSAARAIEYLEQIREQPDLSPQMIILDVNMPEMNGLEFLERLALLPDYTSQCCIAIMLSSDLSATDLERAKNLPFRKKFINKPFNVSGVMEMNAMYIESFSSAISS
jgi:CheY-like chemotaxis protein